MIKYRKAVVCPCCDGYVTQEGYTSDFTSEVFHCKNCGATIYTGDMSDCIEYEDGDDENDEDD